MVSYDPSTLNPDAGFKRGATHAITVTTGAEDEAGSALTGARTCKFTAAKR